MSSLQIGPNPSTTNIDLQSDGDIISGGRSDWRAPITGSVSRFHRAKSTITGETLATAASGDPFIGVDATDGSHSSEMLDLSGGGITASTTPPGHGQRGGDHCNGVLISRCCPRPVHPQQWHALRRIPRPLHWRRADHEPVAPVRVTIDKGWQRSDETGTRCGICEFSDAG